MSAVGAERLSSMEPGEVPGEEERVVLSVVAVTVEQEAEDQRRPTIESALPTIRRVAIGFRDRGTVQLDDLVQVGALEVHKRLASFDPHRGEFAAWVRQTAVRAMRRLVHSQKSDVHVSEDEWEGKVRLKRLAQSGRASLYVHSRDQVRENDEGAKLEAREYVEASLMQGDPELQFGEAQQSHQMRIAVLQLADEQREVVCHYFGMHGRPHIESLRHLEKVLGVPRAKLAAVLKDALEALRALLTDADDHREA